MVKLQEIDDPPSENRFRRLDLRHKVFLSYSGADAQFVTSLHAELKKRRYDPFFDKSSLPKGVPVSMANIVPEAAASKLAVFVLSEEFFTRNKNPMLELMACVEAKVPYILPLFYKITVEDLKNPTNKQRWYQLWTQWLQPVQAGASSSDENQQRAAQHDTKRMKKMVLAGEHDLIPWKEALDALIQHNGVERDPSVRDDMYQELIVDKICRMLPPDLGWDVSKFQGRQRLCEIVDQYFSSCMSRCKGAGVVAVHGASGIGKTSLCICLVNFYFHPLNGRVFYLKLDAASERMSCKDKALERAKSVLLRLTSMKESDLEHLNLEEARIALKDHLNRHTFFLGIDNVDVDDPECMEEVKSYLKSAEPFKHGTRILITSRNSEVLSKLGFNMTRDDNGFFSDVMPSLNVEDAKRIFIKALPSQASPRHIEDGTIMQAVELCKLKLDDGWYHYHPYMLNTLPVLLTRRTLSWKNTLTTISKHEGLERVFKVLELDYLSLDEFARVLFLDIALHRPRNYENSQASMITWLCYLHHPEKKKGQIEMMLGQLKSRSFWSGDVDIYIHDLLKEFAVHMAPEKSCFYLSNAEVRQHVMKGMRLNHQIKSSELQRVAFVDCKFECGDLDLSGCTCMTALVLVGNQGLAKVELPPRDANLLRSIEVKSSERVTLLGGSQSFTSFVSLENCEWPGAVFYSDSQLENSSGGGTISCSSLQVLQLSGPITGAVVDLQILSKSSFNLKELCLECKSRGNLEPLRGLKSLRLKGSDVVEIKGLESGDMNKLRELSLVGCHKLESLTGLHKLIFSHRGALRIQNCHGLKEIDGIGQWHMVSRSGFKRGTAQFFNGATVSDCGKLMKLNGLQLRTQATATPDWIMVDDGIDYMDSEDESADVLCVSSAFLPTFELGLKIKHLRVRDPGLFPQYLQQLFERLQPIFNTLETLEVHCGHDMEDWHCQHGIYPPDFSLLQRSFWLKKLEFTCGQVEDVSSIAQCSSLTDLDIRWCPSLERWPDFRNLPHLRKLAVPFTASTTHSIFQLCPHLHELQFEAAYSCAHEEFIANWLMFILDSSHSCPGFRLPSVFRDAALCLLDRERGIQMQRGINEWILVNSECVVDAVLAPCCMDQWRAWVDILHGSLFYFPFWPPKDVPSIWDNEDDFFKAWDNTRLYGKDMVDAIIESLCKEGPWESIQWVDSHYQKCFRLIALCSKKYLEEERMNYIQHQDANHAIMNLHTHIMAMMKSIMEYCANQHDEITQWNPQWKTQWNPRDPNHVEPDVMHMANQHLSIWHPHDPHLSPFGSNGIHIVFHPRMRIVWWNTHCDHSLSLFESNVMHMANQLDISFETEWMKSLHLINGNTFS